MKKSFDERLLRILEATGAKSDSGLARTLDIRPPSVAAARKRKQIPSGWIEKVAEGYSVKTDWLFFGIGPMREGDGYGDNSEEVHLLKEKIQVLQSRLQEKDDTIRVLSMAINALQKQAELQLFTGGQNFAQNSPSITDLTQSTEIASK